MTCYGLVEWVKQVACDLKRRSRVSCSARGGGDEHQAGQDAVGTALPGLESMGEQ